MTQSGTSRKLVTHLKLLKGIPMMMRKHANAKHGAASGVTLAEYYTERILHEIQQDRSGDGNQRRQLHLPQVKLLLRTVRC